MPADEKSGVEGTDSAVRIVKKFLELTVGTVKLPPEDKICAQIAQHGFNKGEPFHVIEFDQDDGLEQIANEIIDACEADIEGNGAASILYSVMLMHHNGRTSFSLYSPSGLQGDKALSLASPTR